MLLTSFLPSGILAKLIMKIEQGIHPDLIRLREALLSLSLTTGVVYSDPKATAQEIANVVVEKANSEHDLVILASDTLVGDRLIDRVLKPFQAAGFATTIFSRRKLEKVGQPFTRVASFKIV